MLSWKLPPLGLTQLLLRLLELPRLMRPEPRLRGLRGRVLRKRSPGGDGRRRHDAVHLGETLLGEVRGGVSGYIRLGHRRGHARQLPLDVGPHLVGRQKSPAGGGRRFPSLPLPLGGAPLPRPYGDEDHRQDEQDRPEDADHERAQTIVNSELSGEARYYFKHSIDKEDVLGSRRVSVTFRMSGSKAKGVVGAESNRIEKFLGS